MSRSKKSGPTVDHYFGPALKSVRERKGLGVRQVAQSAPCAIAHLYDIEDRESDMTFGMARRLCRAIGISLGVLVREGERIEREKTGGDQKGEPSHD